MNLNVLKLFFFFFFLFAGGEKLIVDVKHGQPQELDRLPICATANSHYHDLIPNEKEHAPMDNRFTPLYFFTQVKHNPPPQAVANGNLETPFVLPPKQKISGEHLLGIDIMLHYTTKIFFKRIHKKTQQH